MPFEKPQKGNPHKFTVRQHIHTAYCIGKFVGEDKKVEVKFIESGDTERKGKRSMIFCAKRNWDESTEKGLMGDIEKIFHEVMSNPKSFQERDHQGISKYFLLWYLRHHFYSQPIEDAILHNITGSGLTKKEEEILESKGAFYIREGGEVPARFITGTQILMLLDYYWPNIKDFKWGLLQAQGAEFIVADCYQDLTFMPISPTLAFSAGHIDSIADPKFVAEANKHSVRVSSVFYFAKSLSKCPIA